MAEHEAVVPSSDEVEQLPRWAQVAFAARCARRIQPLFVAAWPEAPQEYVQAVEQAINLAEKSATEARAATGSRVEAIARALVSVADAADGVGAKAAAYVAYAVDGACALGTSSTVDAGRAANVAYVAHAADAAYAADTNDDGGIGFVIRKDFEQLRVEAKKQQWTDETPVPASSFTPLWPEGKPSWVQIAASLKDRRVGKLNDRSREEHLRLTLCVHGVVDADEVAAKVCALRKALNKYHIVAGGNGLVIDDWKTYIPAMVSVEVLQ